jgi:hypothetical protein
MMDIYRRILYIGLASLLFIGLSGISLAEPNEGQNMITPGEGVDSQDRGMVPPQNEGPLNGIPTKAPEPNENLNVIDPGEKMGSQDEGAVLSQNEGFPMGVPLEVLYSGHGFALEDNESHILRLKVETIMPLQPDQIRDLLSSNKSLEEIRDEIRVKEDETGEVAFRGSMILDRDIYPLVNIVISTTGNNSTAIRASLADTGQQPSNETTNMGNISVIISPAEGGMIGNGELEVDNGPRTNRYSLLLDMEPPRQGQKKKMRGG